MIEIIEMRGKVDATHRLLRNRRAAPTAGREATLVVTGRPQELADPCDKPALVVARNADAAGLPVLDPIAFRTDALLYRKLHRQRRVAASDNLGLAALLDLPREDLACVFNHPSGLRRYNKFHRLHSHRLLPFRPQIKT